MSWAWLALSATLLAAPEPEPSTHGDEQVDGEVDGEVDAKGDAEVDAWTAAGWGAPAEPDQPEEPDEPAGSGSGEAAPPQASAWSAAGWGEPSEAQTPTQPEPGERDPVEPDPGSQDEGEPRRLRVGDVLTGSLRLTGAFQHYDDVPELFPNGDDALVVTVGRAVLEADAGEHVHFSVNGFFELARVPSAGGLSGSFASAGSTASAYRTRYLVWNYWESGAVRGQLGLDRAAIRVSGGPVDVDIGRFPVNYAVTTMFTTNDFFAPFSATAVNRIYKPGVDAIRVSAGLGPTASVDVVGVLGYDPDDDRPAWGRSAVLARAAVVGAGFEWALLGGKVSQRWVGGGSIQGDAGPFTLRSEFHVGVPDAEGDGHGSDDHPVYGRVAAGPSLSFAWQNASVGAEYMFASDGAARPADFIDRALRSYSDDLPYLGRHYVAVVGGMEIIPILRISATSLISATDGSGLVGVSLQYSVADESDLILGVFVPWGKGLVAFDPAAQTLELGSEFGLAPVSAYLEARVFF